VIVMNSTAMLTPTAEAIRRLQAARAYLYLDRDATGREVTEYLRSMLAGMMVEDRSDLYAAYIDFNEFWMQEGKQRQMGRCTPTAAAR
jgi:hypothetical protein